jgi:hypothetical protein
VRAVVQRVLDPVRIAAGDHDEATAAQRERRREVEVGAEAVDDRGGGQHLHVARRREGVARRVPEQPATAGVADRDAGARAERFGRGDRARDTLR